MNPLAPPALDIKHDVREDLTVIRDIRAIPPALAVLLMACPSLDDEVVIGGTDDAGDEVNGEAGEPEPEPGVDVEVPQKVYFIGESTDFSGGGACSNDDVNDVTSSLALEMQDAGWVGIRWSDGQTWAEDFAEGTFFPNALDGTYADAATVSVYAGHGNVGIWQWGQPSGSGACVLPLTTAMRLGTLAGDRSTLVMSLTSCTGRADRLWSTLGQTNRVRQILAYHNSPVIWANQPRDFFRATESGLSNRAAWLTTMASKPGVGKNSPSLLTLAGSEASAIELHESASLAPLAGLSAPSEAASAYVVSYLDYGCGTCGCPVAATGGPGWQDLSSAAASVGAAAQLFPSTHPVVTLTRPQRSEAQRVAHVDGLLELAEVAWDPEIVAWLDDAGERPDELSLLRLSSEATWLLWVPSEDRLALVRDRPLGSARIDEAGARVYFGLLAARAQELGLVGALEDEPELAPIRRIRGQGPVLEAEQIEGWRVAARRSELGAPLLGAGMTAVVQADGRLVMLELAELELEPIEFGGPPPLADELEQRWADVLAEHRTPASLWLERLEWAFVPDPSATNTSGAPRLVATYVLGYPGSEGGEPLPSRQHVVALSAVGDPALRLTP